MVQIRRLLDSARDGRGQVLVLSGAPGVGKSVLVDQAAESAEHMRVLRARGVQSEAHIPFAALADLLRPILFLVDRLPGPQAEALQGALALVPSRAQDRFAIGSATLSLLAACAEAEPLLAVVDDAQWIDWSSADALAFAFRRLGADPVAVLLAIRSEHTSPLITAANGWLDIPGLDLAATSELLAAEIGSVAEGFVERLHRETGGNPLALLEAARHVDTMRGHGPLDPPLPVLPSVSELYRDRIRGLAAGAFSLALLVASGDLTDVALLARAASGLGVDLGDLAGAEEAHLLGIADGRVEFLHPLMRSAVYHGASPEQRRRAHRALASALPDTEADRRAWHLALAALGPDPEACFALVQAGDRALKRNAYEVASRAFERASQLAAPDTRRAELLQNAAQCAWEAGVPARAVELVRQADGLPAEARVRIALTNLSGQIAARQGPVRSGLAQLLSAARDSVERYPDDAAVILANAVQTAFYAADTAAMLEAADAVRELRHRVASDRAAFFAAMVEGMAYTFSGRTGEGAEHLHLAIDIAAAAMDPEDPQWHAWVAMCHLWLRESRTAPALLERAAEVARSRTALGVLLHLLCYLSIGYAASDRWAEAEAGLHQLIDLARETEQWTDLAAGLARLGILEARQGNEDSCLRHVKEASSIAADLGVRLCRIWALAAEGELYLALGRGDAAATCFTAQQALLAECGVADVDLNPGPELVELRVRDGDRDEAAALAVAYRQEAMEKGLPWAKARASRAYGLVAPESEMADAFEEALKYHLQTPDRFETARTQLLYGARLRRARHRVAARQQLRAAVESFDLLGAMPWAAQARVELTATGETARARGWPTRDQLTPQELQIALLLAGGRTTREAAAALFLSPKTIEYHLRNAYRKLDCHNRDELAAALSDR